MDDRRGTDAGAGMSGNSGGLGDGGSAHCEAGNDHGQVLGSQDCRLGPW